MNESFMIFQGLQELLFLLMQVNRALAGQFLREGKKFKSLINITEDKAKQASTWRALYAINCPLDSFPLEITSKN